MHWENLMWLWFAKKIGNSKNRDIYHCTRALYLEHYEKIFDQRSQNKVSMLNTAICFPFFTLAASIMKHYRISSISI